MKKHLRKRYIVTTVSAASIGVLVFIGGLVGSSQSDTQNISEMTQPKVEKKRGKYAAENSEKARFFAAQKMGNV